MDSDYTFGTDSSHLALEQELGVMCSVVPVIVFLPLHSCSGVVLNEDVIICPWPLDGRFRPPTYQALQFRYSHLLNFSWRDEPNMTFQAIDTSQKR